MTGKYEMRMVYGVAAGAEILLLVICALRAPKRKSDLAKIVCLYEWAVVFCGLSYFTFLYARQAEMAVIGKNVYLAGLGIVSVYVIYTEIYQLVRAETMDKREYVCMEPCEHRHVYEQYMDAPHFPGNHSGSGEQKYPVWKSRVVESREYDILLCDSGAASDYVWIDVVSCIPFLSDPL